MTKCYHVSQSTLARWVPPALVRRPTYPERRGVAFRHYPVGWLVHHPVTGASGHVTNCTQRTVTFFPFQHHAPVGVPIESVVSCTARQARALIATYTPEGR